MSEDVVTRAEALMRGTIPGPWIVAQGQPTMNGIPTYQVKPEGRPGVVSGVMCGFTEAALIAEVPSLVPELVAEVKQLREKLDELHREWGLQYDKHPSDVVFGRPSNPDGTITQVIAMPDKGRARQAHASHAPIGAINKFVVSRLATDWRIVDDLDA